MVAKIGTKILIKAKQTILFFFNERKLNEIKSRKCGYRNVMNFIVYRINTCWKESVYGMVWYGMVWYAILSHAMVWYGKYGMLWNFIAVRCLFYTMVYVVKDKHSATACLIP